MGFCNIWFTYFKLSFFFHPYWWICSVYGYITHSLGWVYLPCRCKQKLLSLMGLSRPIGMIHPLYRLNNFELLFWDEFVHLVALLCKLFKMSPSTQFVVDFVHFMDLRLNLSIFGMSPSTLGSTSNLSLGMSPSIMWTINNLRSSLMRLARPLYGSVKYLFQDEPILLYTRDCISMRALSAL